MIRTAACIILAPLALAPAQPVDAQSRSARNVVSVPARVAIREWNPAIRNKQIVVPVDIRFDNAVDYDAFANGRLPVGITLTNGVSGQTIRFSPQMLQENMEASSDRSGVVVYVLVSNPLEQIWDADGCFLTGANAVKEGVGVEIMLRLTPCAANASRVAGQPIPGVIVKGGHNGLVMRPGAPIKGVIVKGGRNPSGDMRVTPWPGYVGEEGEAQLSAVRVPAGSNDSIVLRSEKGAGSPKASGF